MKKVWAMHIFTVFRICEVFATEPALDPAFYLGAARESVSQTMAYSDPDPDPDQA
jgi:hypothetical protein